MQCHDLVHDSAHGSVLDADRRSDTEGPFPTVMSEALAAYRAAVFCLQPWGDTATRKGFWDALSLGCIPVVFTDAGWNTTDQSGFDRVLVSEGPVPRPALTTVRWEPDAACTSDNWPPNWRLATVRRG